MLARTENLLRLRWNSGWSRKSSHRRASCNRRTARINQNAKLNKPVVTWLRVESDMIGTDMVQIDVVCIHAQTSGYKDLKVK